MSYLDFNRIIISFNSGTLNLFTQWRERGANIASKHGFLDKETAADAELPTDKQGSGRGSASGEGTGDPAEREGGPSLIGHEELRKLSRNRNFLNAIEH